LINEEEEWLLGAMVFENFDNNGWMCGGFYLEGDLTGFVLDVALFNTDFDGNLNWYKSYDLGLNFEFARSIWKTDDEGYYLAGSSLISTFSETGGYCMIKTDKVGNKEWEIKYDESGWDYCNVMGCRQTTDGGYIISGITDSFGTGDTDLWFFKIDENGTKMWNKTYGGPNNDRHYAMDATENQGEQGYVFLVTKNAGSISGTKDDIWIINTDTEGNTEWQLLLEQEGIQYTQYNKSIPTFSSFSPLPTKSPAPAGLFGFGLRISG